MSYFVNHYFIMLLSDDEEDQCFIELDTNSNSMISSHQKFLSFRKKRLLHSCKKEKVTKRIKVKSKRNKFHLYRNNANDDGTYVKMKAEDTYWYRNYVLFPNHASPRFTKKVGQGFVSLIVLSKHFLN